MNWYGAKEKERIPKIDDPNVHETPYQSAEGLGRVGLRTPAGARTRLTR